MQRKLKIPLLKRVDGDTCTLLRNRGEITYEGCEREVLCHRNISSFHLDQVISLDAYQRFPDTLPELLDTKSRVKFPRPNAFFITPISGIDRSSGGDYFKVITYFPIRAKNFR